MLFWSHNLTYCVLFQACQSEKQIGQFYTLPSEHIRLLFPHGLPKRYQQQAGFV